MEGLALGLNSVRDVEEEEKVKYRKEMDTCSLINELIKSIKARKPRRTYNLG